MAVRACIVDVDGMRLPSCWLDRGSDGSRTRAGALGLPVHLLGRIGGNGSFMHDALEVLVAVQLHSAADDASPRS